MGNPPVLNRQTWNRIGMGIFSGFLLILPALAFSWWGNPNYPETFPSEIENLDRTLYIQGGQQLFPSQYQRFHDRLLEIRDDWRTAVRQWWLPKDGTAFHQTYKDLLQEGTLLLEAIRQKSLALRMDIDDLIRPEFDQVDRLRSLASLFEMGPDVATLSHAESQLQEAATRLEAGQFGKARLAVRNAVSSLHTVETHMVEQMRRYADPEQLALWNQWVQDTIRWSAGTGGTALVIHKASRKLFLYRQGQVVAEYPVDLGFSGLLDKQFEGDGATPEGRFRVIRKKSGGETKFYRTLLINYPSPEHQSRFQQLQALGEIPEGKTVGGAIEIHGKNLDSDDRTNGCIALENPAMEHVFQRMALNSPITIVGAVDTNNDVVGTLHTLEDHIQRRDAHEKEPSSLRADLYAKP